MPDVVIMVTTALIVVDFKILLPVVGLIPPLAKTAPKFERD